MSQTYKYSYDPEANALYIYVRDAEIAYQREYSEDVILDLGFDDALVGIELLDPGADISRLVRELGLDPHVLDVLNKMRDLFPDAHKQLVLA
jgi:uncharacterized protein YuzE